MDTYPKISIITPNFNGEKYLEETIRSVVEQGYPNLEYIVVDGGSTDGSMNIIEKFRDQLADVICEPDHGLYDALRKGFAKSTGEIMGWINSDDILLRKSLFAVGEIFRVDPKINWIQGYPTVIDAQGRIVFHRPQVWSKYFFYLKGYHDGRFIQQESTFWKRSLWEKAGATISTEYKFAGDFELWIRFFNHDRMYLTNSMLGSFRIRNEGQMSKLNYREYLDECDRIIDINSGTLSGQEKEELARFKTIVEETMKGIFTEDLLGKPAMVDFDLSAFEYRLDQSL